MRSDPDKGHTGTATFVGGLRWPAGEGTLGGNATTPLVRLHLDGDGAHLVPNGRLARVLTRMFLMPTYDLGWSDIRQVERLPRGVRFITASLAEPVIFWTTDPDRVLEAIERYSTTVDRQPQRPPARPRIRRGPLTRRKLVGVAMALWVALFANILWTIIGLPGAITTPLRVLVLILCALYVLAVVVVPDDYWTRGR